jgi:hypothetical protein
MGIDHPLKSASLAPAATWRSWRGEVRGLTNGTLSRPSVVTWWNGPVAGTRCERGDVLERPLCTARNRRERVT